MNNVEEGTKICVGSQSSIVVINIFTHNRRGWTNPYGNIDRGHHRHIRMEGILFLRIYADIMIIRPIRHKKRLADGLEFHIR